MANEEDKINAEDLRTKVSCIQIDLTQKETKIDVHGGYNAIGNNAKIVITQGSIDPPDNIWWMVRKPVATFTGREHELQLLHEKVTQGDSTHRQTLIADKVSAVTGLGGIGKSELARMYAHVHGPTFFNSNVIWINAEDDISLRNSFSGLADYMGIEVKDASGRRKDVASIVQRVYHHFKNKVALFIFDNAELLETTRPFLPVFSPAFNPPYVLLTSRNQNWGENVTKLELDMLSEGEAIELVCKCLRGLPGYEIAIEDAKKLAEKLQCFPLALQQAVSYIKKYSRRRKFAIDEYLDAFDKKTKEVLSFPVDHSEYVKTVYITWQVTFDKLEAESNRGLVVDILGMIAYMHADDIPFSTFLKLADNEEDALWDALELLEQYSMIKRSNFASEGGCHPSDKEAMYSIHRLVQTVLQLQLGPNKEGGYLEKVLVQMEKFVQGRYGNFDCDRKFLYHAMAVVEHCSKNLELFEKFCYLPVRLVDAMLYQARYDEATDYAKEQYDFMLKSLGIKHHATLAMQFNVARSLHCVGRHEDARVVYEKAVEDYTNHLGPLHRDTLAARIDQAFLYIDLNNPRMSLELFQDIYEKKNKAEMMRDSERSSGNDVELYTYRDVFTALYGIAHSHQLLEQYDKAEEYYRMVYDKRRICDGEFHARTLHAGNKLCEALMKQRKYDEAGGMLDIVYNKQKEIIGENHPHTRVTEGNIINVLVEQKRTEEALKMLNELYDTKVKSLGQSDKIVMQLKKKIDELRDCKN
eukprot:gene10129-11164_t